MEEVLSSIAILGFIVVGVVDFIKYLSPKVHGAVTVTVAIVVGTLWALVDGQLGFVPDLSIPAGISAGLVASGVKSVFSSK